MGLPFSQAFTDMEAEKKSLGGPLKWIKSYCKLCSICVYICPAKDLMIKGNEIVSLGKCTKCQLCEKFCPDFAIEVEK